MVRGVEDVMSFSGADLFDLVQVRKAHGPRVECRNLVVVEIGGDKGLGGEGARHLGDVGAR